MLGGTFEFVFHSFALTLLFCGEKTIRSECHSGIKKLDRERWIRFVISFSCGEQMENDAREFVGCSRDGRGGSVAGTHFSIVSA